MNLYLRLLFLLCRLPWLKKQSNPLLPTTLSMHVMPNDLDFNLHVNNGRYLTMLDLGRIHLMAVTGLLGPTIKNRWQPVVGSIKVHFIRSLGVFEKFKITTQVIYWDEKWIYMEQKIIRNDSLYLTALVKGLFTGKEGKIPPEQLLALLPHPVEQPQIPHTIKHWIDAEKASRESDS